MTEPPFRVGGMGRPGGGSMGPKTVEEKIADALRFGRETRRGKYRPDSVTDTPKPEREDDHPGPQGPGEGDRIEPSTARSGPQVVPSEGLEKDLGLPPGSEAAWAERALPEAPQQGGPAARPSGAGGDHAPSDEGKILQRPVGANAATPRSGRALNGPRSKPTGKQMKDEQGAPLYVRLHWDLWEKLDVLRWEEDDKPNRQEMIRRLIDRAQPKKVET